MEFRRLEVIVLALTIFCAHLSKSAPADNPDLTLVVLDGREYTCKDIVGVTYSDGIAAVARVEKRFGKDPRILESGWQSTLNIWYSDQPAPKTYLECYHQQLGGATAYFVLGRLFDQCLADYPELALRTFDKALLDEVVQKHCSVMQSLAAVNESVFLSSQRPELAAFREALAHRGLTPRGDSSSAFNFKRARAPFVALYGTCKRFEVEGKPTAWADSFYRFRIMAPLLERIFVTRIADCQQAYRERFGEYSGLVFDGVSRRSFRHIPKIAKRLTTEDGLLAEGGVSQIRNILAMFSSPSELNNVTGTMTHIRTALGVPEEVVVIPGKLVDISVDSKSPQRRALFIYTNSPNLDHVPANPKAGTLLFEVSRDKLLGPMLHSLLGRAEFAKSLDFPAEDDMLRQCTKQSSFFRSLYGVQMVDPLK